MLTELLRLSSGPSPSNTNPGPAIELQTASNDFASDVLALSTEKLSIASAEQLQDSVAAQLDPERPHTPEQLASAGNLFAAMLSRSPSAMLPRGCALLASVLRSTAQAPDLRHSAEIVAVAESCMAALCQRVGCKAPSLRLSHGVQLLAASDGDGDGAAILSATSPPPSGAPESLGRVSTANLDRCAALGPTGVSRPCGRPRGGCRSGGVGGRATRLAARVAA